MLMLIIVLTEVYSLNKVCLLNPKCAIEIAAPWKFKLALHNYCSDSSLFLRLTSAKCINEIFRRTFKCRLLT